MVFSLVDNFFQKGVIEIISGERFVYRNKLVFIYDDFYLKRLLKKSSFNQLILAFRTK
ncbi:hypothetical protein UT300005_32970 [Clostridium sp. CTA-5]